jgi:2-polyprenyl-3-methyl-5-hydroxy-6-metoxy-1,4-benzoquinol methylase
MMDDTEAGMRPTVSPEPLMQMIQGIQVTAILQAAVKLRLFDLIAQGNDRAASIASAAGADERGTRILLDALAALGLLETGDGVYALSPLAEAFLVSSRPSYLGGMLDIMAGDWAWTGFPRLADAVRGGGTVLDEHAETPGHEFWEAFAPSSVGMATPAAHRLAEIVGPWAAGRERLEILDVACGSGLYSLTLAAGHGGARTTLADWPNVLEWTRENVDRMGLAERASYRGGDIFEAPLGGPYDLVIASHIFHHFSEARCRQLLARLFEALAPGGRLAINDFMPAGARPADEPFPHLFSIMMLTWTRDGEAYPLATYERLLREVGFGRVEAHPGIGMPSTVVVAERE